VNLTDLIPSSLMTDPFLAVGATGAALMLGYLGLQGWSATRRYAFESRRSRMELELLAKRIEILNRKVQSAPEVAWNGFRKFTVSRKVLECEDTYSLYLSPHNGRPLPAFKPGQYLTFEVQPVGSPKAQIRCYSLSDGPLSDAHYRVTIKRFIRDDGTPGVVSSYFCDEVREGDILNVKAPSGKFFLDVEVERPVVLISGGIGITPMLAMARLLTHHKDPREIYFFFGCRSGTDHMFRDEVIELQRQNPHMRLHICYSRPAENDTQGRDFNHHGRVTIDLMKEVLPSSNYEYYLCGPGPFMDSLVSGLYEWGVAKKDVKFEAFGPATVKKGAAGDSAPAAGSNVPAMEIEFSRSGKKIPWDADCANLHAFAEKHGVPIDYSCGAGSCGSCLVAIKQGTVHYDMEPGHDVDEGSCLTCICRPSSNLVIDA
jgi:ferredoxin-NADP reductase